MPIIPETQVAGINPIQTLPNQEDPVLVQEDSPSVSEVFGAAFRQENTLVSWASNNLSLSGENEPVDGYDALDDVEGYEMFAQNFIESNNPGMTSRIKEQIDLEQQDKQTLAAGGVTGFVAQVAAGISDPMYWPLLAIPGGAAIRTSKTIGQASRRVAAIGGISEIPAEAAKQYTQETRTVGESLAIIAGATALSGILGGAVKSLSKQEYKSISKKVDDLLQNDEPELVTGNMQSMGAARVRELTQEELELVPVAGLESLGVSPVLRSSTSPSVSTRQTNANMMESPFVTKGNVEGVTVVPEGGAVETRIKLWDAGLAQGIEKIDELYTAYRSGLKGVKRIVNDYVMRNRAGALTAKEFREEVGRTMRRGDVSDIPEVQQAAEFFRKNVFDPMKDAAIKQKLLPPDVDVATAVSYLTRVYNTTKIAAKRGEWDSVVEGWLGRIRGRAIADVEVRKVEAEKQIPDEFIESDISTLDLLDRDIIDRLPEFQQDAVKDFSGIGSIQINKKLRAGEDPRSRRLLGSTEGLDFAIEEAPLPSDVRLFRKIDGADVPELKENLAGKTFTDKGYLSTSTKEEVIRKFDDSFEGEAKTLKEPVIFKINAAKGEDALPLPGAEKEVLLPRNAVLNVVSDEIIKGERVIVANYGAPKIGLKKTKAPRISASLVEQAEMSDITIKAIADDITNAIMGNASGRIPYEIIPNVRGPLKERTFNIPDELIEDFLESDVDLVARQYTRTMAPDIELNRMFGSSDLAQQVEDIASSYKPLIDKAKTEKDRIKLKKRMEGDIRDIEAMRDMLRGTYRVPEDPDSFFIRAGRTLRDVNFVRMLGGMTISAIPDLARPIAVNGLRPVARGLKALAFSGEKFKMAKAEAKKNAIGLDMVINSRVSSLADITDIYNRATPFERGLRAMSDVFGKMTLMSQWNAGLKQFVGVVTQDRILEESIKLAAGKASKNSIRRLATSGIDKELAKRIAREFKKHGTDGDVKLSNGHLWIDDQEAMEALKAAVLKDVDRAIITPGKGEKPLWTSSETGKMVFQFKSFAASAHQKILIADLQHRDAQALSGFLMSVALGSASYGMKEFVAGREISDDPSKILVESLDRSGAFGYFWDTNNIIEKMTRGEVGVNKLIGAPPMSRYQSRNILGSLLGPSVGTVQDIAQITGAISTGEIGKSEIRKIRRLLPMQNLFYMRQLLTELEDKTAESLGVQQ